MMQLTPDVSLLDSVRSQYGLSWPKLLGELIDNALDAEAESVEIDFSAKGQITVADNGRGCSDLSRMLVLGRRKDHGAKGATGRYGIGAKDALIGLGDEVCIASTCKGETQTVTVNWGRLRRLNIWECADPHRCSTTRPSGTRITISALAKAPPKPADLLRSLGVCYAPAIDNGRRILVRFTTTRGWQPVESAATPPLAPALPCELVTLGDRRDVFATAGLISDPAFSGHDGVTVTLEGHRVITARSRIGLEGEAPAPGFYARLELRGKGWRVAKNKDDMSDADRQTLAAFVRGTYADLIAEARRRGTERTIEGLGEFFAALARRDRGAKARRSPPVEHTGAITPTDTGRRHTRAARTQDGSTFTLPGQDRVAGSMSVKLAPQGCAPLFELHDESHVIVNTDHPGYAVLFGPGMERQLAVAILCFYASQAVLKGWRKQLPLPYRELDQERAAAVAGTLSDYLATYAESVTVANGRCQP